MGIGAAVASVALGARVIEKHFTLRRADGGVDSAFSMEPEEMHALVVESERAFRALGKIHYGILPAEEKSRDYKRSVYSTQSIRAGEVFTRENIRVIRPGKGLEPKYYEVLLGKKASRDIPSGSPLQWESLFQ
jgi:sialic acid synthase SpsE